MRMWWLLVLVAACGGGDERGPTFGAAALTIVLNPVVNDAQYPPLQPAPGPVRAGVTIRSDDGVEAVTDARGVALLAPLTPGTREISVIDEDGGDLSFEFPIPAGGNAVHDLVIAATGTTYLPIIDLDSVRPMAPPPVRIGPGTSVAMLQQFLAYDGQVVIFEPGEYLVGELLVSGGGAVLVAESLDRQDVTLVGDITMSGGSNWVRGIHITGNATMNLDSALSLSRVDGAVIGGRYGNFVANEICGLEPVGRELDAVANIGMAPLPDCR